MCFHRKEFRSKTDALRHDLAAASRPFSLMALSEIALRASTTFKRLPGNAYFVGALQRQIANFARVRVNLAKPQ
jgi:hypothetical protein